MTRTEFSAWCRSVRLLDGATGSMLRAAGMPAGVCSERYHFMHFKLPQKKENPPKALTREDFLKIRDLEIPERRKSLALTRDLFLFACYTGTAYADTVSITEENLFRDEEGSLWLKYHRKKNKMLARVKLLPEALAMLEKYKDPTRPTLLPPQEFRNP